MNILFVHQNFPGQFIHLAANLATDHNVVALAMEKMPTPPNVVVHHYALLRAPAKQTHPLLSEQEAHVLRAEACAAAALQLKRNGFTPDLIVAHPGWGEALFLRDVFPHAKIVLYCEYFYAAEGQDVGFDPEHAPLTFAQRCALRLKNSTNLQSMEIADAAISPTEWQRNTYPEWARKKITVIHDGIDSTRLAFNANAQLKLQRPDGRELVLRPGDEVLSYVSRNLEPVRGFKVFMRALPKILHKRPQAQAVVVGGDSVSYGPLAPGGRSWKEHMLNEVGSDLDLSRVHFIGQVPYQSYLDLMNVSRIHTYWTTPFVLSWSFLEAAISGVPLIASATPPVEEFAAKLGIETWPFHDHHRFADALVSQLEVPRARIPRTLQSLELSHCLRRQKKLLFGL